MAAQDVSKAFNAIVGTTLESVTFVMDYVQLQFGPAQLTAYTLPQVDLSGRSWTAKEDYPGPEAFALSVPGQPTIVS